MAVENARKQREFRVKKSNEVKLNEGLMSKRKYSSLSVKLLNTELYNNRREKEI